MMVRLQSELPVNLSLEPAQAGRKSARACVFTVAFGDPSSTHTHTH